jgi:hypothetical protein
MPVKSAIQCTIEAAEWSAIHDSFSSTFDLSQWATKQETKRCAQLSTLEWTIKSTFYTAFVAALKTSYRTSKLSAV